MEYKKYFTAKEVADIIQNRINETGKGKATDKEMQKLFDKIRKTPRIDLAKHGFNALVDESCGYKSWEQKK